MNAQCSVGISYQQALNSISVTFTADSVIDRGNGLSGAPNFYWTFSNGTTVTGQQVTEQPYLINGGQATYMACLTMRDSLTGCNVTVCDTVIVGSNANGNCGTSITYTNTDSFYTFTSANTGIAPYTYAWSVNGQSAGTSATFNTTIIDSLSGSYTEVCVNVTDSSGCVATNCAYIGNNSQSNCNVYAVYTNHDSLYNFTASYIGVAPAVYQWSYNNTPAGSTDSITLVLDSANLYPNGVAVCVTMTDANGCVATSCAAVSDTFTAGNAPCQANFVITTDSLNGDTLGNYYGYNLSTGNYGSDILWSFGDGTTSTDPYPVHNYTNPGIYIVCLTIGIPGTSCYSTYCDSSFYVSRSMILMHSLTILNASGINQVSSSPAIGIYPNPVYDELNITGAARIEQERIFNIAGQKVFEAKAANNKADVSKLSPGVYILEVISNGIISRTKFVKS